MELGVCLDLGGTLVRGRHDWEAWSSDLRAELAIRPGDAAVFDEALARALRAQGPVTLADACLVALRECGRAPPRDLAVIAARASARHAAAARLMPDADEALVALELLGVPLAIVTNGPDDMQLDVLRATGLHPRRPPVRDGDVLGRVAVGRCGRGAAGDRGRRIARRGGGRGPGVRPALSPGGASRACVR